MYPKFTPTKRSNAQHLIENEKQLLFEENQKSENVMQQPMDSCVCGINTSYESILIKVIFIFCAINRLTNSGTPTRRVNLTKRENFLTSNLYHKRKNA